MTNVQTNLNSVKQARLREASYLIFLLAVSVAVNVGLAIEVRALRRPSVALPPFHIAPPMILNTVDGQRMTVQYDGQLPTFIYWFSPTCGWCERNFRNFEAVAHQSTSNYRFLAVSAAPQDELKAYAARHKVTIPLYTISVASQKLYQFRGTPASMFISKTGELINMWNGAYGPTAVREIGEILSLQLPDVVLAEVHTKKR